MIARFENQKLTGQNRVSAHKYENLHNLPHWHMEYELVFIEYGTASAAMDSAVYELTQGHCLFISSGTVHKIQSLTDCMIIVVKIDQKLVDAVFDSKVPVSPLIVISGEIMQEVGEILHGQQEDAPFSDVFSMGGALRLLAKLLRSCPLQNIRRSGGCENYKALLQLIDERYADITFAEAADFMCYSKPYFSRYFTRMTGMSFSAYLNIIRVAEAVSMIMEKRMTMTEIAHASGFGTIRHFNRVFRELTGYAPSELPEDYVFIQYRHQESAQSFDPTLSAPAII